MLAGIPPNEQIYQNLCEVAIVQPALVSVTRESHHLLQNGIVLHGRGRLARLFQLLLPLLEGLVPLGDGKVAVERLQLELQPPVLRGEGGGRARDEGLLGHEGGRGPEEAGRRSGRSPGGCTGRRWGSCDRTAAAATSARWGRTARAAGTYELLTLAKGGQNINKLS